MSLNKLMKTNIFWREIFRPQRVNVKLTYSENQSCVLKLNDTIRLSKKFCNTCENVDFYAQYLLFLYLSCSGFMFILKIAYRWHRAKSSFDSWYAIVGSDEFQTVMLRKRIVMLKAKTPSHSITLYLSYEEIEY